MPVRRALQRLRRSAADQLLQMFQVPRPLDRNRGDGAVDLTGIARRQFDPGRADILLQAMPFRSAGDRDDPRFLSQ